jgi:uncharacterized protein YhbP (UPF0306 family)
MTPSETTRDAIRNLLQGQRLGVLSTVGHNMPYANLVAYVASEDDRHIYFATQRSTRKFANLTSNPRVALLVTNIANQPEDFHQASAVTAVGIATPLTAPVRDAIRIHYLSRHPHLEDFIRSPDCEILDIRVSEYILVERFQDVSEYCVEHETDPT